jgi:hypothetical protein
MSCSALTVVIRPSSRLDLLIDDRQVADVRIGRPSREEVLVEDRQRMVVVVEGPPRMVVDVCSPKF